MLLAQEARGQKRKTPPTPQPGILLPETKSNQTQKSQRQSPQRRLIKTRDDRKQNRSQAKQENQTPQRFQGQTFLEQMAVSRLVAEDYRRRMQGFLQFARAQKVSQKTLARDYKRLDEVCNSYVNHMFDQGLELAEGTKFLAATCDMFPGCGQKHTLARTRRSLQGWLKLEPQRTRPPLPWPLLAALVMQMLKQHRTHSAAAVLLSFTAYLRPGEVLHLRKADLVNPMPRQKHWSLLLHPAERQERSKVGLADESILLDSPLLPWIGPALRSLNSPGAFLLDITYYDLVQSWQAALKAIGLPKSHAVLYQLRHSGPSHDRFYKLRPLSEVKQRGRWQADSSVRRYEAHARLNQEFNDLPAAAQRKSQLAEQMLPKEAPRFFGLHNSLGFRNLC